MFYFIAEIAPGPSKIAPGSGEILWTRSNFYKKNKTKQNKTKNAPGSGNLISKLGCYLSLSIDYYFFNSWQ